MSQGGRFQGKAWGEALVVDCAEYGLVFGLLGGLINVGIGGFGVGFSPGNENTFGEIARTNGAVGLQDGRAFVWLSSTREELKVPVREWPLLVQFEDLNAIETACLLAPIGAGLEFPSSVKAKNLALDVQSVTIEMTNEAPSSKKIERLLPWIRTIQGNDGSIRGKANGSLAENLSLLHFERNGAW